MDQETKNIPTLVSIIPNLVGGEGHIIPYHKAVTEATKILGWEHKIAYSNDINLTNIPENWTGCLKGANLEDETNFLGKILKFIEVIIFAKTIVNYLKIQVLPTSEKNIIFIERFIHLQLFALYLAILFIPKKDLHIWILYRMDTHNNKTRLIYKTINLLIKNRVSANNFKLLTDSELLSKALGDCFQEKVIVMPIPHTESINNDKKVIKNDEKVCWWAGPPREEKGWNCIKLLTQYQSPDTKNFCLVAAKSSQLISVKGGIKVKLIEDNLTRIKYKKWLANSDIILLPYDSKAYKERTSGIFTESVIAGKITVVSPNTWMAKELAKYHLEELIIDWTKIQEILNAFNTILKSYDILDKIKIMQAKYQEFHNIKTYANTMKNIYSQNE